MIVRNVSLATAVVIALQVVGASGSRQPPAGGDAPLQVSHRARAVAPGEVVIVDIRTRAASAALQEVQARWLSQTVLFYQVDAGWWQGLAPVDVAGAAGRYTLEVRARATDGRTLEQPYRITIAPRTFPARRITVAPKFVESARG